jgi:hypothetical protein
MSKFKTFVVIGASALSLCAASAVSAQAQPWNNYSPAHRDYESRQLNTAYVDSLDWRITNAARQGRISWGEARALRAQFRQVQPIAWRVETGQASRWEYQRLARVVARIEAATGGYAANRGPRYGYGYGNDYDWRR